MSNANEKWEFKDSDELIIIVGSESSHYKASVQIRQTGGGAIAESMEDIRKANAHRICLCINSHDALLAACKGLLPYIISEWEGTDGCLMCRRPMRYHANDCVIGKAEQAIEEAKR